MNRQQILSRLARRHAVLYSTGTRTPQPQRASLPGVSPLLGAFDWRDGVIVDRPPRWLRRARRFEAADRAVIRLAARRWLKRLAREDPGELTAYAFHPKFWPFVAAMKPARLVYHAYDLLPPDDALHSGRAYLATMLRAADVVLASSETIREQLVQTGAAKVTVLPNAVDFAAFARPADAADPGDLCNVPHPRIGYAGRLNRKVDFGLIATLATKRPDWHFVLIGEAATLDESMREPFERLGALQNVHLLGHKPVEVLPEYVARMDVNLMCYRLEPGLWTEGIFPLKLFEYLASGQPVVSADVPSVRAYSQVIAIARDAADWEALIARALVSGEPGTRETRRELAAANTWDHRVRRLEELLSELP